MKKTMLVLAVILTAVILTSCTRVQVSDLEAGTLLHVIADAHIYDRHVPYVKDLMELEPYPAPKFRINPDVKNFYDFTTDDFELLDYQSHEFKHKIPVAV